MAFLESDNKSYCNSNLISDDSSKPTPEKSKVEDIVSCSVLNSNNFFSENLTSLTLKNLKLTELPELPEISNLYKIDLSENLLYNLPEQLVNAKSLRILNISRNKFNSVPNCLIYGLKTLKRLDLSENCLNHFDEIPACLPLIKELILCHNLIEEIPDWILSDYTFMLDIFDLSFNPCFTGCRRFNKPTKSRISGIVKRLFLKNTGFTIVSLGLLLYFPFLSLLDISNSRNYNRSLMNAISDLKEEFLAGSLEELYVQNISLACLPEISNLKQLQILDLSYNLLQWLPPHNFFNSNTKVIKLSCSKLIILPDYIGQLKHLTHVMLSENDLSILPSSFHLLVNLEVLDLYNNSFQNIPELVYFTKLEALDLCWNYFEPSYKPLGESGPTYEMLKKNLREKYNFQMRFDGVKESVRENSSIEETSSIYSISPEFNFVEHENVIYLQSDDDRSTAQVETEELWDLGSDDNDEWFDPSSERYSYGNVTCCARNFGEDCVRFCSEEIQNSPHLHQPYGERINSECWKLRRIVLERAEWSPVDGQFEDPE